MPEYKRRLPGRLSKGEDEFAEEMLYTRLKVAPIRNRNADEGLWSLLQMADPSTQKRVIAYALNVVASSGHTLPIRLAEAASAHLTKPTSRNRIKDIEGMKKAARFQAENPTASLREIGEATGRDHTVIRNWKKQFHYKRELLTQLVRVARELYNAYVERFGSPFAAMGLPEPPANGLLKLRGAVCTAMANDEPITDRAILESAMHDPLSRAALGVDQKSH